MVRKKTPGVETSFLIVDKQVAVRGSIQHVLHGLGVRHVRFADSYGEALSLLQTESFDYLISEWDLPDRSGLELVERLRGDARYEELSIMLIIAETSRERVAAAIHSGVNGLLAKPFNLRTLHDKLEHMLRAPAERIIDREPRPMPAAGASTARHPKILVVDDVPENIETFSAMLRERYQVKGATNATRALQIARANPDLDLVLLDIVMPDTDGLTLFRQLQEEAATVDIPVMFLTGKAEVSDVIEGLESGAVDYLTKPVSPALLRARVATQIALKRSRDTLKEEIDTLVENARLHAELEQMTCQNLKRPLGEIIRLSEQPTQTDSLLANIRQAAYELLGLVNRSQDLYQLEHGGYCLQPVRFDLSALLHKAVDQVASSRGQASSAVSLHVVSAPEQVVEAEELLCFSMLENLLSKALDIGSALPGRIDVRLEPQPHGATVAIEIPHALDVPTLEALFARNPGGSPHPSGQRGSAYVARLIARAHGGDIATKTAAGKTRLELRLPATPS